MFRGERFAKVYDLQKQGRTGLYRKLFFRNASWSGRQSRPRPPSALEGFVAQLENAGILANHCLLPDVSWMADDMSLFLEQEGIRKPYVEVNHQHAVYHVPEGVELRLRHHSFQ